MKIKCNIITPMLMHGEDTGVAELRPPSIKGAMRFWWRAIQAIHGNLSLKDMKKQESMIFGGAVDESAVKSSFRIKINSFNLKSEQINPLPHKKRGFNINGYKANQSFEVEFLGENLELIKSIFRLSTILGGFGQRSRRGFGSIQIIDNWEITKENIKNLIKSINPSFHYSSDNSYPYIKTIEIGKEYQDMNGLIKTINLATHNHNKDGMFGSVRGGRYASPIYISIIKDNKNYRPIITTLNATKKIDEERLNEFKKDILS